MSTRQRPAVVVVTGMSGAGKTTALRALDDLGFYCVDNLPPALVSATVRMCAAGGIDRVALGMGVRVGEFLESARDAVEALGHHPGGLATVYLDASDEALMRRFSETRRPHPMRPHGEGSAALSVLDGVRLERERLAPIRNLATVLIDTTHMSVHELRRQMLGRFSTEGAAVERMQVRMLSFGFKHGVPLDADLVFDVRFLDNPYFDLSLRDLTGNDDEVRDFVLSSSGCRELIDHIEALLEFALPRYRREGKSYLTVAIGCTGGRHRSVAIAGELARRLGASTSERIAIVHRDVARGAMMSDVSGAGQGSARDERPRAAIPESPKANVDKEEV